MYKDTNKKATNKQATTKKTTNKNIKTHTFPNGFRLIHERPTNKLPISSIYAFCAVGSAYETDPVRGASHFVEHMCFKGTRKIPASHDIYVAYDKIGAYFNAFTEKQFTCYTVKCEDKYVKHSVEILGDMMMNSTFPKKEFVKEQKVVVEESIKNMNDAEWLLIEKMNAIFYAGSSFENSIDTIEYHPTANKLKYEDVLAWYTWFYYPQNMVMSITSNLSFAAVIEIISHSYYARVHRPTHLKCPSFALSYPKLGLLPISKNPKKIRIELYEKTGMSTNTIGVGFRTCSRHSPDRYIFMLLEQILNGLSGRLFTNLRETHGLTYSSGCITEYVEHTGYFVIQAQTDPAKTIYEGDTHHPGVLSIIIRLLTDLKKNGIQSDEMRISKGNIRGKYQLNQENNDLLSEHNGSLYLLDPENDDEFVSYTDIYDKYIAPITKEQVDALIRKYFVVENMVVGIIGEKVPSKKMVEEVCERFHTVKN